MARCVKNGCMLGFDTVRRTLYEYRETFGVEPNYIIMSAQTLHAIEAFMQTILHVDGNPSYPVYDGVPIAICGKLPFGDFEVV